MLGWPNLWLPMLVCYGAAGAAFYLAGRGKRPFVAPRLLERFGEDAAALLRLRWMLEAAIFAAALFAPMPAFTPDGSRWGFVFGLLPLLVGGIVLAAGAYARGADPSLLPRGGAYAYSRNPILTGRALVLKGLILMGVSDSPAYMVFLLAVLVGLLATQRWIEMEEAFLESECGEEYIEYRKWVPRYFLFF
jgi:protein-S-isoprenylcysteine O-methyltransferase Ste14